MAETRRPTGVAVLAILSAIGGVLCLIGAAVIGILAEALSETIGGARAPFAGLLAEMVMVIAAVLAITGILLFVDAYGLWTGRSWAWWLTIILSVIGIMGGLLSSVIGIISIIIGILIIYYFTRPHVKEFFGLAAPPPPPPPP